LQTNDGLVERLVERLVDGLVVSLEQYSNPKKGAKIVPGHTMLLLLPNKSDVYTNFRIMEIVCPIEARKNYLVD